MATDTTVADELEAIRQVKARYCRFLDTKDFESWRTVFTTDLVSLPRDLRKAGRHMADQDPALDEDHPAVGG